ERRSQCLAPGKYLLCVSGEGVAARSIDLEIQDAKETTLDVPLAAGVPCDLRFTSSVEHAAGTVGRVAVVGANGRGHKCETDVPGDGRAELRLWLAPGLYSASAQIGVEPATETSIAILEDRSKPQVVDIAVD